MLRTFPRLTLSIALLAGAGAAIAQTGPQTPVPTPTTGQPPATERIEPESETPATNIEPRRGTQIREKRSNGQVTEVEVQSGKSRYTLKPNQPAGNAQAGDAQSSAYRAPQWQVMEFDLNARRKAAAEARAAAEAEAAAAAAAGKPGTAPVARKTATAAPTGNVPQATVPMTKPADIPPPPPLPSTR